MNIVQTDYVLRSRAVEGSFEDKDWILECPYTKGGSLIFSDYSRKQLELRRNLTGLFQYSDWLPISRVLEGSASPVTYKSTGLGVALGLENLYVTFNGYWPEKGAFMMTGGFKECEAYSVCARKNAGDSKVMVVASAGNTARAFAKVCSENNIPLLLCVPYNGLTSMWASKPLAPCVKILATAPGTDYYDAIELSNIICESERFYPEGGAKNVARRDGMGTTVLSAVTTIGKIPDYYFQAVGSGTGAIAAWEANKRFIVDGRFGNHLMKLIVAQNAPFAPMYDAWKASSPVLLPMDDAKARKNAGKVFAKVLTNRRPPYAIKGGLYDALKDTGGDVLSVENEDARNAAEMFENIEGIDIVPAAAVAFSALIQSVKAGRIARNAIVMLNITGGGVERLHKEFVMRNAEAAYVFPENYTAKEAKDLADSLIFE